MIPIDDATAALATNGRPKPAKGPPTFVIVLQDGGGSPTYVTYDFRVSPHERLALKFSARPDAEMWAEGRLVRYAVVALPGWPETADRIGEEARREWLARNGKQGVKGGPTP